MGNRQTTSEDGSDNCFWFLWGLVSPVYTSDDLAAVFNSALAAVFSSAFLLCYAYLKVSWDLPW